MADVLTNRLRMTKPDVGGSDDTWGSKLNTDWDIIDKVYRDLTGELVSTTAGSANAHEVTLTHGDYADIDSTLGFRITLRSGATNTGDMTLNVNDGNGPRVVRKFLDGVSTELRAGDFPLHYPGDFVYIRRSGSSSWVILNPALGTTTASNLPDATTTVKGKVALATAAEFEAGVENNKALTASSVTYATVGHRGVVMLATASDTVAGVDIKAVTPPGLKYAADNGYLVPTGSMSVYGKLKIADLSEALNNNNIPAAINPYGLWNTLVYWRDNGIGVLDASTSTRGKIEVATVAEAHSGTSAPLAVNPEGLVYAINQRYPPNASTSVRGIIETATDAESMDENVQTKAVTPRGLDYVWQNNTASTTNRGTTTYATGTEALDGALFIKAINPVTLNLVVDAARSALLESDSLKEVVDARVNAVLQQRGLIPEPTPE